MADVDYTFHVSGPPPAGYPAAPFPDLYDAEPFAATRRARRQTYLAHVARNPAPANLKAPYYELARLAAGGQPHLAIFYAALDYIEARRDCADFVLHAILRLLHQFSGWMPAALRDRARDVLLGFQYWPDECGPIWSGAAESGPAERGAAGCVAGEMCTWTENHQILFAAGAYLAGHLFPDDLFAASGRTGRDQAMHHAPRIRRWLQLRFETGFSEWLSHVYYDEDIVALLSLVAAELGGRRVLDAPQMAGSDLELAWSDGVRARVLRDVVTVPMAVGTYASFGIVTSLRFEDAGSSTAVGAAPGRDARAAGAGRVRGTRLERYDRAAPPLPPPPVARRGDGR